MMKYTSIPQCSHLGVLAWNCCLQEWQVISRIVELICFIAWSFKAFALSNSAKAFCLIPLALANSCSANSSCLFACCLASSA
uniref:Uncharacterized protein n=1 Tax=Rhizophora mucronata TaxID=61149 RepID=A0A2P2NCS7_RHIMU